MDIQQRIQFLTALPLSQPAPLTVQHPMDPFRALMQRNDDDEKGQGSRDREPAVAGSAAAMTVGKSGDDDNDDTADEPSGKRRKVAEGSVGGGGRVFPSMPLTVNDANIGGTGVSSTSWAAQGITNPTPLHLLSGVQGNLPAAQILNLYAQQQQTQQQQQQQQTVQGSTNAESTLGGLAPLAQPDALLGLQGLGTGGNFGSNHGIQHSDSNVAAQDTSTRTLQQLLMQNQAMIAAASASAAGRSINQFGSSIVPNLASAGPTNAMPPGGGTMMLPHASQQQMMFQNQLTPYGMMSPGMGLPIQILQQQQSGNLMIPVGMLPPPSALGIGQLGGNTYPTGGPPITSGGKAQDAPTANQPNMNLNETTSGTASRSVDTTRMTGRRPLPLFMSCDEESLSEFQCLVRKQIQLFEARSEDVESNAKGRNKPIVIGQVGIRCRHCSVLSPKSRARGATYYPAKLNGLYQAAQSMASGHLCYHCQHIPADIRQELLVLKERKSSAGGGKKYWGDGVRVLGVIEDDSGLRFK